MNLLQTMHQIFESVFSCKISIIDFMKFIFNDTGISNDETIPFEREYRAFYRYYKKESGISSDVLTVLQSITVHDFNHFFSQALENNPDALEQLHSQLQNLYRDYTSSNAKLSLDELINKLVYLHMKPTTKRKSAQPSLYQPPKPLRPMFKRKKPRLCEAFCKHQSEKDIISSLKQNQILFLYSLPGTGKTEFSKSLLHNYTDYDFKDAFLIPYTQSLQNSLKNIEYQLSPRQQEGITAEQMETYIARKESESLLIINKMDVDSVQENFKILSELHLTILVTVDAPSIPDTLSQYKFPSLSFKKLYDVFSSAYEKEIPQHIATQLFARLENHVLTIRLLGKALKKSNPDNPEEYLSDLMTIPMMEMNLPEVKHEKNKIRIFKYLYKIINYKNYIPTEVIPELQIVALFQGNKIDVSLLQKWFPDICQNHLSILIEHEIFKYEDTNHKIIQMHRLIADLIQEDINFTNILSETPSSRVYRLLQNIIETIENIETTEYSSRQIQDLSFALYTSINGHHIRFGTNKNQKHLSKQGNLWLNYCLSCIHFYQEYGNTVYSEAMLNSLLDEYAGIPVPDLLLFEKRFEHLTHSWQTNALPIEQAQILFDDIISYLTTCEDYIQTDFLQLKNLSILILEHVNQILQRVLLEVKLTGVDYEEQKKILGQFYFIYTETYVRCSIFIMNLLHGKCINEHQIAYYKMWLNPYDKIIPHIDELLKCQMDSPTKVQLLSDAIYFNAQMFIATKDSSFMDALTVYYKEMQYIYSDCHNIPSSIIDSYGIAILYYGICRIIYDPEDMESLLHLLYELPKTYSEMIRLKDSSTYKNLKETVSKIISEFTCQT